MNRFKKLSHATWDCKYHIVWNPKYRRKELYGKKRKTVVESIKKWSGIKDIEIISGNALNDHMHISYSQLS